MSRTGRIRRFFGDKQYDFALLGGQLIELEESLDLGVGAVYALLQPTAGLPFGQLRYTHVKLIIRLGLIGGDAALGKELAALLTDRHVAPPDLGECGLLARAIVGAAIVGVEEKRPGEPRRRGPKASPSPTAASTGLPSTAPRAPRASRPRKSGAPASGN